MWLGVSLTRFHSVDGIVYIVSRGCKSDFQLSHITFMEVDHEIISADILPILLIQEGQLSVTVTYEHKALFNCLED